MDDEAEYEDDDADDEDDERESLSSCSCSRRLGLAISSLKDSDSEAEDESEDVDDESEAEDDDDEDADSSSCCLCFRCFGFGCKPRSFRISFEPVRFLSLLSLMASVTIGFVIAMNAFKLVVESCNRSGSGRSRSLRSAVSSFSVREVDCSYLCDGVFTFTVTGAFVAMQGLASVFPELLCFLPEPGDQLGCPGESRFVL